MTIHGISIHYNVESAPNLQVASFAENSILISPWIRKIFQNQGSKLGAISRHRRLTIVRGE